MATFRALAASLLLVVVVVVAFDEDPVCSLPADSGPCLAYFPRYFYNSETSKCEKFIYGGCRGNANNFRSLKACACVCDRRPYKCYLPAETGPCRAYFPRYFYNPRTSKCEKFIYGGCQGNANNFRSLKACAYVCDWRPYKCYLPAETGPCKAYFPRYFYNPRTSKCEKFIYGGCRGNANNFKTLRECRSTCG